MYSNRQVEDVIINTAYSNNKNKDAIPPAIKAQNFPLKNCHTSTPNFNLTSS